MATLLEQIEQIKTLIADLELLAFGSDTDTVTHNGQTRPSLKKEFKDKFDEVKAMVEGSLPFDTKDDLDLYTPTANADGFYPLAKVINDPTTDNNRLYFWSGSAWTASKYDPMGYVDESLQGVTKPSRLKLPAIADANGVELLGFDDEGAAVFKLSQFMLGKILSEIDVDGTILSAGISSGINKLPVISDNNNIELLGFDDQGKVYCLFSEYVLRQIDSRISSYLTDNPAYNPVESLYTPENEVVFWGDSMTAGAGGDGTTVANTVATELGLTVYNRGIGGQRSDHIAVRQGGRKVIVTVNNNEIPETGSVAITAKDVSVLYSSGNYNGTMHCSIAGVDGLMTTDASNNWTFTRDSDGSIVSVPADSEVTITEQGTSFIPNPYPLRNKIAVIWSGRNNAKSTQDDVNSLRDDILSMVRHLSTKEKRLLVVSVCNGGDYEGIGTTTYNQIAEVNRELKETFGDSYIDLRSYMSQRAIYDAGITPTTTDIEDIAADGIPESLRSDGVHFNSTGYEMAGKFIARNITAKGW